MSLPLFCRTSIIRTLPSRIIPTPAPLPIVPSKQSPRHASQSLSYRFLKRHLLGTATSQEEELNVDRCPFRNAVDLVEGTNDKRADAFDALLAHHVVPILASIRHSVITPETPIHHSEAQAVLAEGSARGVVQAVVVRGHVAHENRAAQFLSDPPNISFTIVAVPSARPLNYSNGLDPARIGELHYS